MDAMRTIAEMPIHTPMIFSDLRILYRPRHHPARLDTVSAPDVPHMSAKAGRCGARCGTGHAVNQTPARKRQTETRTRPPHVFTPKAQTPGCRCRVSQIPRSPYLWPFQLSFWAPLTWLTAFRSAYLPPQVHLGAEPIG